MQQSVNTNNKVNITSSVRSSFLKKAKMVLLSSLTLIMTSAYAEVIPTPGADIDPTQSKNFLQIMKYIIFNLAAPILVYGGALFFVVLAVFDIYRGYQIYVEKQDFGRFKISLVVGAILVVIGLSMLFLGQYIMTQAKAA